jgi:hypothetical protein
MARLTDAIALGLGDAAEQRHNALADGTSQIDGGAIQRLISAPRS